MSWREDYKNKLVSVERAAEAIKSGDIAWISCIGDTPIHIMESLSKRYLELENVNIYSALIMKPFEIFKAEYKGHINYHTLFLGPVERMFMSQGNIDVTSLHFSKLTWAMQNNIKPNVLMATCTPPDENGYMNFGPAGSIVNYAVSQIATKVILQVNKKMPYVYGERNFIHVSQADYICEADYDLPQLPNPEINDDDRKIAAYITPLINDGDNLQIGIGSLGNAIAYLLEDKKDLGVHTEMLTDSMVHLAKIGVVTGRRKNFNHGKMIFAFAAGSKETLDFIDRNPTCEIKPFDYTNDVRNISANDNMISINNAIAVDLTGQVCSESIGTKQFSATGGQVDYVRGATMSKGGKSFIALNSTAQTKKGVVSKITTTLAPGSVVTTPRADVQYIVTEYGIVNLYNKSIAQRVEAMISIAHPDFREQLRTEAKAAGHI